MCFICTCLRTYYYTATTPELIGPAETKKKKKRVAIGQQHSQAEPHAFDCDARALLRRHFGAVAGVGRACPVRGGPPGPLGLAADGSDRRSRTRSNGAAGVGQVLGCFLLPGWPLAVADPSGAVQASKRDTIDRAAAQASRQPRQD